MIIDVTKSSIESKVEVGNLRELFWPHIYTMRRFFTPKHWKKFREISVRKHLQSQGQDQLEYNIVFWQNGRIVAID